MKAHFQQFARYNHWANAWVYAAAAALPDEDLRRPLGLFFGSVHATLNHLLLTDRMWLGRVTGEDRIALPLNTILHQDLVALKAARTAQDERLIALIESYADTSFDDLVSYQNSTGKSFTDRRGDIFAHLFNHQTHHRGQVHSGLSILTGTEPPPLDLLAFQRGAPLPPG